VLASEEVVELAIENLLDNASSFAPPGSAVTVALWREAPYAVLAVSDEGPGVAPHLLEKIFERHYSDRPIEIAAAGATGSPASEHFGLGLWIVRHQVQGVGGTVFAKPNRPRGLTVIVRLQLADA
jgi:two-component system sensor histidine kinase ChvG